MNCTLLGAGALKNLLEPYSVPCIIVMLSLQPYGWEPQRNFIRFKNLLRFFIADKLSQGYADTELRSLLALLVIMSNAHSVIALVRW